jgi:hypothetical protein
MCDEPKVISDACRAGKSEIDRTLCDDKQLQAAQHGVWEATKDVLRMIFGGMIGKPYVLRYAASSLRRAPP